MIEHQEKASQGARTRVKSTKLSAVDRGANKEERKNQYFQSNIGRGYGILL